MSSSSVRRTVFAGGLSGEHAPVVVAGRDECAVSPLRGALMERSHTPCAVSRSDIIGEPGLKKSDESDVVARLSDSVKLPKWWLVSWVREIKGDPGR